MMVLSHYLHISCSKIAKPQKIYWKESKILCLRTGNRNWRKEFVCIAGPGCKLQLPPSLYMKQLWANTLGKKDCAIPPICQLGSTLLLWHLNIAGLKASCQRSPGYTSSRRVLVWYWEGRWIATMWRNVRVVRSFLSVFTPTHGLCWDSSLKAWATGILESPAGASLKRGSAQITQGNF